MIWLRNFGANHNKINLKSVIETNLRKCFNPEINKKQKIQNLNSKFNTNLEN